MATKSNLINSVDTMNTGGVNTALELRGVLNTFLDEFYRVSFVNDTQATTNVLTDQATGLTYDINIKKQGGVCFIDGIITNESTDDYVSEITIAEITNTEYLPQIENIVLAESTKDQSLVSLKISNSLGLYLNDVITKNETIKFSGIYYINQ